MDARERHRKERGEKPRRVKKPDPDVIIHTDGAPKVKYVGKKFRWQPNKIGTDP
jgi:hypothetical protein